MTTPTIIDVDQLRNLPGTISPFGDFSKTLAWARKLLGCEPERVYRFTAKTKTGGPNAWVIWGVELPHA